MVDRTWVRRYEKAQSDEGFQRWLTVTAQMLDGPFRTEEVPDLPGRPWGREALDVAEAAALRRFPDGAVWDPTDPHVDLYARFVGQVHLEAFDGRWVAVPEDDGTVQPAVLVPFNPVFYKPRTRVRLAMRERSGTQWSTLHGWGERDRDRWIAAGRPDPLDTFR